MATPSPLARPAATSPTAPSPYRCGGSRGPGQAHAALRRPFTPAAPAAPKRKPLPCPALFPWRGPGLRFTRSIAVSRTTSVRRRSPSLSAARFRTTETTPHFMGVATHLVRRRRSSYRRTSPPSFLTRRDPPGRRVGTAQRARSATPAHFVRAQAEAPLSRPATGRDPRFARNAPGRRSLRGAVFPRHAQNSALVPRSPYCACPPFMPPAPGDAQ